MSVEMGVGILVVGVLYAIIKDEIHEIRAWWKQEKKINNKRRW